MLWPTGAAGDHLSVSPGTQNLEMALAPTIHNYKLNKILEVIEAAGQDLRTRADVMEVSLLSEEQKKLSARVTSTESDLRDFQPSLSEMEVTVRSLTDKVRKLGRREKDSEYRSQRNNIQMAGFPDGGKSQMSSNSLRLGWLKLWE
ncbi:hypothetical protein NDU88_005189 [Pleurodeles waltl]|uniref:Uncharacterized protein n=1 Tax=Pleurodeles waltl TaxID=8319 RepID=A0AAV7UHV3_PLEWA|nr:hypothetical protein NDU88_005189 [Pleurodeles waltl]